MKLKQSGAATLIITVILMIAALLIMIYAVNHSVMQSKTSSNQYASSQSYEAAEAGMEFGIQYLAKNYSTVTASPSGGFINYGASDSNVTNVSLANGSKFSIVYTNPTANDYTLIKVSSTGTSSNGSSTRTVSQLIQQKKLLTLTPTNPSTVLGTVSLSGSSATIINMTGNTTVVAGSSITFSGNASTVTSTSGSDKNHSGNDIQPNSSTLSGQTAATFFQTYFGTTMATVQNEVANFYPSGSSPSLAGMTGTSIWVDQDYTQTGNVTIGSSAAPVLLIVNGNLTIGGGVTIYGFVYVTGGISSQNGTPQIIGGFASAGNLSLAGNPTITYDNSVLNATRSLTAAYGKVPGSWKDF